MPKKAAMEAWCLWGQTPFTIIEFLNRKFKELGQGAYEKNRKDIFNILREYGNEDRAIRFAKRIIAENKGKTPSEIALGTKVYELVEELKKYCC